MRQRAIELSLAALLALVLALDFAFPPPRPAAPGGAVVLARDGTPLRSWADADGVWRHPVAVEDVSPLYLEALLGYEDRWFYWHPGVNPLALARAAWQWVVHGRIVSGGSTLTMQVARIVDPPPAGERRSVAAKSRQVLRALQLELRLSKREILALYLNHAPMGGNVEGVEAAARGYLGKPARTLSPAEAALLAALPQAPSRLRPDRAPRAAQAARDKVLARLAERGVWPAARVSDARLETVAALPLKPPLLAPLAAERVRSAARRAPDAVLRTTLDTELQASIERVLFDRTQALPPKVSMAVMVVDNATLEVLAYAGSADFADRERAAHVDMVRGVRSPGSTLKPFLYAMALDDGLIHSESLLVDAPQSFGGWQPGNFQADFAGPVSVSQALQRSLNVPAVDLLERIGPARFASKLRAGGVKLRMERAAEANLSLILGGAGTTLEELVGAYRALAAGGLAGRPRLQAEAPRIEARLMSDGAAFIVRDILEAGGHPDRPFAESSRRLAWKTGTSFGFRDAWAIGVTDAYTAGVWIGRPDGTPNPGFFGANAAAPLLHDIVALLPGAAAPRTPPSSVSAAAICWPLGLRADASRAADCQARRTGWLLDGTAPPTLADRARTGGLQCGDGAAWPVALGPWLAPSQRAACAAADGAQLRIRGLEAGSVLKAAPGAREVKVAVAAQGARAGERLYWLLDGRPAGAASPRPSFDLRLAEAGTHDLTVLDEHGRFDQITFSIARP